MLWWWLSFADEEKLRGIVIVQAPSFLLAVAESHRLQINPHGEVRGFPFPSELTPPEQFRNRCLTREEAEELDRWAGDQLDRDRGAGGV